MVPVSDMTIWRWERDGIFPRHLSINSRNYWCLSELREWIDRQERAGGPAGVAGVGDEC
jgi:predicted DNA-binding transcriptional regulator AlpA